MRALGWQPEAHQIIYRANILIAETQEKAQQALAHYPREAVFRVKDRVTATLLEVDSATPPARGSGGIGCGVVDLSIQTPGSEDPDALMEALELFSKKVQRHIRDI